ncbi:MAG: Patatin [Bryobacterales bacterium]|nr:Patatin [Bryobacterales bacterium]
MLLAMLTVAALLLLLGRPSFTNASRPPRFGDPMLALQFARDVQDIDWILGDAPSPDREVMRVKQYADFAFITCYTALFLALSTLTIRKGGWRKVVGIIAAICGLVAGLFDVLENRAILNILDLPLRATTPAMIQAIRGPATAKWILAGVTVVLLSAALIRSPKTS